jgi:hypothetical protein
MQKYSMKNQPGGTKVFVWGGKMNIRGLNIFTGFDFRDKKIPPPAAEFINVVALMIGTTT